jgi:hypothetical protein
VRRRVLAARRPGDDLGPRGQGAATDRLVAPGGLRARPPAGPYEAGEGYGEAATGLLAALPRPPVVRVLRLPGLEDDGDDIVQWLELHDTWEPERLRVEVTYGRIGTRGRCRRYTVQDEAATRKQVRKVLQRRATAKRRTGVSYRVCELVRLGGMALVGDDTRQAIPRVAKALSGRSPHGD